MMEKRAMIGWMGPVALVGLGMGALWDGLYAPAQQLVAVALAALLALGTKRRAWLAPLEWLGLLLLAMGLVTSLRNPAAAGAAAHGPAVVAGWVLAMVAGRSLSQGGRPERSLARFWAVVGTLIAFGGICLISFTPPHHSGRLASFLGYPVAVGILGLLGLAGSLPDLAAERPWSGILALGNAMAILLSGSRGVWAVAALLAAYLLWAAPDLIRAAAPRAAAALWVALGAGLWAAPSVASRGAQNLRLIALIALLTILLLDRFQTRQGVRVAALVIGGFALARAPGWGWLLGRATALPLTEGSSVERLTFLRDGAALVASTPWGAGYRGWTARHLQAASYGYYSGEVHSAPLDLAIAFGWAGGAALLLLVALLLWRLRLGRTWPAERVVVMGGMGALALHALLDWDLSYGLFSFPLWFAFGLASPRWGSIRWPPWLTVGLAGFALAASAILGAGDLFTALAERSLAAGETATALRHAGAAVAVAPWNDLAHAYRGQAQVQSGFGAEAIRSLTRARALGPHEPWYAQLQARELARQGRLREAASAWSEAVRLWPWQVPVYEEALQAHLDLIRRAERSGNPGLASELTESGRALLTALEEQKRKEPPGAPRKGMAIDTPIIRAAREVLAEGQGG